MRLACGRPLPRQGSLPGTRNGGDLSSTRPNFAGGRSRPQTGACLPPRRLRSPKQAPVYPRADCVTPNRRLFTLAQIAWSQTGACLLSRRLRSPKQAPVWGYKKQKRKRKPTLRYPANFAAPAGACLPLRRPLPRQGSLPGTRNDRDLPYTRPNFAGGRSRPGRNPFFAPPERVNTRLQPDYP